jgi:LPXTG-motif cell wall-anchored protein
MFLNLFKKENFAQTHSIHFEFKNVDNFNKKINVGDTINWHWDGSDMPHSIKPNTTNFPLIESTSNTATATFTEVGSYSYECGVHGNSMSGIIVVDSTDTGTTPAAVTTTAQRTTPAPLESTTGIAPIVTSAAPVRTTTAPVRTTTAPVRTTTATPSTNSDNNKTGLIIGIIIGVIVIGVGGYMLYQRKRK